MAANWMAGRSGSMRLRIGAAAVAAAVVVAAIAVAAVAAAVAVAAATTAGNQPNRSFLQLNT